MPTTPQLDRIFEILMILDKDDENKLIILEQEVALLEDDELDNLIKVGKKYRKTLTYFYNILVNEKKLRKQGVL